MQSFSQLLATQVKCFAATIYNTEALIDKSLEQRTNSADADSAQQASQLGHQAVNTE